MGLMTSLADKIFRWVFPLQFLLGDRGKKKKKKRKVGVLCVEKTVEDGCYSHANVAFVRSEALNVGAHYQHFGGPNNQPIGWMCVRKIDDQA